MYIHVCTCIYIYIYIYIYVHVGVPTCTCIIMLFVWAMVGRLLHLFFLSTYLIPSVLCTCIYNVQVHVLYMKQSCTTHVLSYFSLSPSIEMSIVNKRKLQGKLFIVIVKQM